MKESTKGPDISCPVRRPDERITLAHGAGGRAMSKLIREVIHAAFRDECLAQGHDGAVVDLEGGRAAFTTDSYVVSPIFFPGGDIGSLAVHGTVNDLAMCGAEPKYLSFGVILEEGLELETVRKVAASAAKAAAEAGVRIVTGDTKVVERGKGDLVYVSTSGLGRPAFGRPVLPEEVRPGDAVLVSGDVGAHGAAILSVREGLEFETALVSDSAPVWPQVRALLDAEVEVHCLRDLTRGGLATALCEVARDSKAGLRVSEKAIGVRPEVAAACEILGLDPLYMACEGRFAAFVAGRDADKALSALKKSPMGTHAAVIGEAVGKHKGEVRLETVIGVDRVLDMLAGEQLPRIC